MTAEAREKRRAYMRTYNASPARKASRVADEASPGRRATRAAYQSSPEGKAVTAAYNSSPAGRRATRAAYKASPEGKAVTAAYEASPAGKAARTAYKKTETSKAQEEAYKLKKNYGITIAERDALLVTQGGVCQICAKGIAFGGWSNVSAVVDHDHDLGHVRGILCSGCNKALGLLNDSPAALLGALRYLDAAGIRPVMPAPDLSL